MIEVVDYNMPETIKKVCSRATMDSCGYDIFSPKTFILWPLQTKRVNTNRCVRFDSRKNFGMIVATSSLVMRGIDIPNGSGIIDYDYYFTGKSFSVIMRNTTLLPIYIKGGTKIGQMIIMEYLRLENEYKPTKERVGGFGSTNESK